MSCSALRIIICVFPWHSKTITALNAIKSNLWVVTVALPVFRKKNSWHFLSFKLLSWCQTCGQGNSKTVWSTPTCNQSLEVILLFRLWEQRKHMEYIYYYPGTGVPFNNTTHLFRERPSSCLLQVLTLCLRTSKLCAHLTQPFAGSVHFSELKNLELTFVLLENHIKM